MHQEFQSQHFEKQDQFSLMPTLAYFFLLFLLYSLVHTQKSQIISILMYTKAFRKNTAAFSLYFQSSGFYFASKMSFHLTILWSKYKYKFLKILNFYGKNVGLQFLPSHPCFCVLFGGGCFSKAVGRLNEVHVMYQSTNLNVLTSAARNRKVKICHNLRECQTFSTSVVLQVLLGGTQHYFSCLSKPSFTHPDFSAVPFKALFSAQESLKLSTWTIR